MSEGLRFPAPVPSLVAPAPARRVRPDNQVLAVVSPASGCRRIQEIVSRLYGFFREQGLACEFLVAPGGASLRLALTEALDAGYRRVFAAAGSAGLRHVFNAVADRDVKLAVLPSDGSEEFTRWLGLPSDLLDAAELSGQWSLRPVRMLSITFANGAKELAWGVAQAGPAVEAGWLGAERPVGSLFLAMLSAGRFNVPSFELSAGEEHITGRLLHFAIVGPIAPQTHHSNGAGSEDASKPLEAVLAGLLPASQLLHAISSIVERGGFEWPLERHISADRLRLVTDPPIPLFVDSEVVGFTPLEIEVAHSAVRLLLPAPEASLPEKHPTQTPP